MTNGVETPLSLIPFRQGFVQRALSPLTAGGVRQSTFTLISTAMGGGVLCLPYVMDQVGWLLGSVLLTIAAGITYLTMYLLIICANRSSIYSYGSLLGYCTGPWIIPMIDMVMFIYGFGTLIAYFILLGDFLPALAESFGVPIFLHNRSMCMILAACIALPFSLRRRLSALQYVAPIATFSLIFTTSTVVYRTPEKMDELPENAEAIESVHLGWQVLKCFSISLFAYICHLNVVPVAGELIDPTPQRVAKICGRVAVLLLIFYITIGISGNLSFSNLTHQNFITNYRAGDSLINCCRLFLSMSLLCCIPININPTASALLHFVEGSGLIYWSRISSFSGSLLRQQEVDATRQGSQNGYILPDQNKSVRYFITVVVLVVTLVVGLMIPGIADVVSLLGGSLGTLIMMTAPCVIFLKVMDVEAKSPGGQAIVILLLGASIVSAVAIAVMTLSFCGIIQLDRHQM